jgi:hypothetical protein
MLPSSIFLFAEREGFAPSSDGAPGRMTWRTHGERYFCGEGGIRTLGKLAPTTP